MVNKLSQHTQTVDEKMAAEIAHGLNKSLDDIDELSLQRLKNARVNALAHSATPSRRWLSASIAASLVALVLIPVVAHKYSLHVHSDQEYDIVSQDIPYSAEEMDDIEMLMSLEAEDA